MTRADAAQPAQACHYQYNSNARLTQKRFVEPAWGQQRAEAKVSIAVAACHPCRAMSKCSATAVMQHLVCMSANLHDAVLQVTAFMPVKPPPPPAPRSTARHTANPPPIDSMPQLQHNLNLQQVPFSAALQHAQPRQSDIPQGHSFRHWIPETEFKPTAASPLAKQTDLQPDAHSAAKVLAAALACSPDSPCKAAVQHKVLTQPAGSLLGYQEWKEAVEFNPQFANWLKQSRRNQAMWLVQQRQYHL